MIPTIQILPIPRDSYECWFEQMDNSIRVIEKVYREVKAAVYILIKIWGGGEGGGGYFPILSENRYIHGDLNSESPLSTPLCSNSSPHVESLTNNEPAPLRP